MLSVITVTYNALGFLPKLVSSLEEQTSKDFEWIVVDGNSSDGTVEYLNDIKSLNMKFISEKDFGIYDALNKGIGLISNDYYLVVGADDILYKDAVEMYCDCIETKVSDIYTAGIDVAGSGQLTVHGCDLFNNISSFVSGHSVGTVIKKDLHDRFGMYSEKYSIAADYLFIKTACEGGATVSEEDFVAGVYNLEGVSSTETLTTLTEKFRIQMNSKKCFFYVLLFLLRIIKNYPKI